MRTLTSSDETRCEYILLIATPSEEKALKEAAKRLGLKFEKKSVADRGSYFDLGRIAGVDSSRLIAIRTEMGPHGFTGSASKATFFLRVFGAQAVISLGMAFGVDPTTQAHGDVLVAVGLLPYDDRTVQCADGEQHRYIYERVRLHRSKESLVRLFERHRDALKEERHAVFFGTMLSGSLRIQCGAYRDLLIKDVATAASAKTSAEVPQVVGGEMEGIGLLSTSSPDNPSWIVVKGISDFADGKDPELFPQRRTVACTNAVEFVLRALVRDETTQRPA